MARNGARWEERGGIGALITPDVPQRSLGNAVFYEPPADIPSAYEWLEELYRSVDAWTVWVPHHDEATARALEERGHALDAGPLLMQLDLATFDGTAIDWAPGTPEQLAAINEAAYPWQDGSLGRLIARATDADAFRIYVRGDDAALAVCDYEGDAYVTFVATRPEARGRGLASGLLTSALLEARERGCDVSSLVATRAGAPIYARLGYREIGVAQMWEKRRR